MASLNQISPQPSSDADTPGSRSSSSPSPISSHLIFYLSIAQTLRCVNGFKYQRRCHKLTLCLATEKLRQLNMRQSGRADEEVEHAAVLI
ncbi:hypothetical protein QQ045_033611 [Rhodiola kirilowii]